MKKVALFDFCETLVDFQTADAFVDFTRNRYGTWWMCLLHYFHILGYKTKVIHLISSAFPDKSINKRIILYQLKGLKREIVYKSAKEFYYERIKPHFISVMINEFKKQCQECQAVYIVSGGYDVYLQYFIEDFCISKQNLICTEIKFKNDICCGTIEGADCIRHEKVRRLESLSLKKKRYTIAYSDSQSDLPFLNWADVAYVVRNKKKNNWNFKYKEIIW